MKIESKSRMSSQREASNIASSSAIKSKYLYMCSITLMLLVVSQLTTAMSIDNNEISDSSSHDDIDEGIDFDGLYNMFGGGNPKETPDGFQIVEGDIVDPYIDLSNNLTDRKAINEHAVLWPSGVIPYSYHDSITPEEKVTIAEGMKHWEEETCIRFKEKVNSDFFFINFRSDTPGCWSLVGRRFMRWRGGQDVSIGKGCAKKYTVAHEIGHAIGFYHEQSRSDRDEAIHIIWDNVLNGFGLQFRKERDVNYGVPYDYKSVMQYPSWAFSKEVLVKNTIVTLNPRYQRLLGKNRGLTFRDKKIVNHLYYCDSKCSSDLKCLNGGFRRTKGNSSECVCECPPTTTGAHCETVINDDYYEAEDPLLCGGNITTEGVIETPDYPRRLGPYQSCAWIIEAPKGNHVSLTFEGFEFAPRAKKSNSRVNGKCLNETVEIRTEDDYIGTIYCGTDIKPGTTITSKREKMIVIIVADDKRMGKGLRAKVKFVEKSEEVTTQPSRITRIWNRIISGWNTRRGITTRRPYSSL